MSNGAGQKKSFWSNPWMWTGLGCCGGCIAIPLIMVAMFGGGIFYMFGKSGANDLKAATVEQAKADPRVIEALGEPIEVGWLGESHVSMNNGQTVVRLGVPLSGPKGKATLRVEAEKADDGWKFQRLAVEVEDGGQSFELTPPAGTLPEAPAPQ